MTTHRTLGARLLRPRAVLVAGLLLALLAPVAALAQRDFGRIAVGAAPRTDEGEWAGTWYFVSRNLRFALWMRGDKNPELRLRLFNSATGEGFETDWSGHAEYVHDARPGVFDLKINSADRNVIEGDWRWEIGTAEAGRLETAVISMYRSSEGMDLVMNFEEFERVHRDTRTRRIVDDQVLTFRKASRRLALWEELPF